MNSHKRIFLILMSILGLTACRKDQLNDCFQGTGLDITEIRSVGSFTKISIAEKMDVVLTQDTNQPEQIKITAGSKVIGQIVTKVENQTLVIENKNVCNFVRDYKRKIKIEIRVKFLSSIVALASANIQSVDTLYFNLKTVELKNLGLGDINLKINAGFLNIQSRSSGNIVLEGFANIISCSIEEITIFDGRKLLCDDVYLDSHSPLDCFVNPKNKLAVKIFNKGNVFYLKEPEVLKELSEQRGKGQLLKL
jgi:hypothetical protein